MEENRKEVSYSTAARWYARLRAPDCTQSERTEFEKWLQASPDNVDAYQRAEKLASLMSSAATNDARFAKLADAALVQPKISNITQWRVAAALVIGIAIALFGLGHRNRVDDAGLMVEHSNFSRQQQRDVLEDGSVVYLDVGSRLSVRMNKDHRSVQLLAGRAYFEVVHNEHRPFTVNAGDLVTTDLGTRFQVSLTAADVSVTLVEGAVQVTDRDNGSKWRQTLQPGEQVLLKSGSATLERREVDATALTSWSTGRLVFKGAPLAEVLDEVNRYSDCKIHLGDAALASIPIGGNFIAGGDSSQVIDALAAVLPLRVVRVGNNEIVLFQRNDT